MTYKKAKVYSGSDWIDLAVANSDATQRTVGNITTTTHTLVAADAGKALVCDNTSAITMTVPNDTTYNFTIGQTFVVIQKNTGAVTVQGESGVAIDSLGSKIKTNGQYSEARLIKIAANEWLLSGDLSS
jgi:hypothetical protein